MVSFKLKLVIWFALLALLPLAVAFYGYDSLIKRSETRRADAALEAGLRGAVAAYGERLSEAAAATQRLAVDPALQQALRAHDRQALAEFVTAHPGATVSFGPGTREAVLVVDNGVVLGSVLQSVPIDAEFLQSLSAGLAPGHRLLAARFGQIIAGTGEGEPLPLKPGRAAVLRLDGILYRGLETAQLPTPPGLVLAELVPEATIGAPVRSAEERILVALIASLLLFGVVTYLLGRSIVGTLRRLVEAANGIAHGRLGERVEVRGRDEFAMLGTAFNHMAAQLESRLEELETERARVRGAAGRFGEALMATHDSEQLIRVVVESAVEATGARGGAVVGPQGELARAGDPDAAGDRIAFPLRVDSSDFGSLVLVSEGFDAEQVETAGSLAAQVAVALENARLHRLVERQALVDGLTGLANRRSLEETLHSEVARVARFGDSVCVVMADLDNFKLVNDRYGHAAGDRVLQGFAAVLRETVRESDTAARWGGEEFALVLTGTAKTGGAHLAERARSAFASRPVRLPDGLELAVTASFGVAAYPEFRTSGDLLAAADAALYEAKRAGRNRVMVSSDSSDPQIV
ncbi:MAG TPA: diguanylate cyclase [Gaiellaceae bacterium]|nr:diguanylate cyclase [Gaiellaceae bacterium]